MLELSTDKKSMGKICESISQQIYYCLERSANFKKQLLSSRTPSKRRRRLLQFPRPFLRTRRRLERLTHGILIERTLRLCSLDTYNLSPKSAAPAAKQIIPPVNHTSDKTSDRRVIQLRHDVEFLCPGNANASVRSIFLHTKNNCTSNPSACIRIICFPSPCLFVTLVNFSFQVHGPQECESGATTNMPPSEKFAKRAPSRSRDDSNKQGKRHESRG